MMRNTKIRKSLSPRRRKLGFTMVEVMIAMVISSGIAITVSGLQLMSAKSTVELFANTRTRGSRAQAIDQIRYRLYKGTIALCEVTENGNRIEFEDAVLGATSAFFFSPDEKKLYYDQDVDDATDAAMIARELQDVVFVLDATEAIIHVNVSSLVSTGGGEEDFKEYETQIYLRNI